jgi:glucose-6-phosphate 1-dehydrogenase
MRRTRDRGDAIVVFGITGDLAFKHIIPALQRMVQAEELDMPVDGGAPADRRQAAKPARRQPKAAGSTQHPVPAKKERL